MWHVVSNELGTVLGVYGAALLGDAQALCKRVEAQTGLPTFLHHIKGPRPSVGQSISMKGVWKAP